MIVGEWRSRQSYTVTLLRKVTGSGVEKEGWPAVAGGSQLTLKSFLIWAPCVVRFGGWLRACNTLKFASFEIDLKWANFEFLCSWKHREIIFFTKLKFIIRCSNIVVHTCWCICVLYCLVLTKDQNEFKLSYQNAFRSIFLLWYTYIIFLQSNSFFSHLLINLYKLLENFSDFSVACFHLSMSII
jgi:hypothetical protein